MTLKYSKNPEYRFAIKEPGIRNPDPVARTPESGSPVPGSWFQLPYSRFTPRLLVNFAGVAAAVALLAGLWIVPDLAAARKPTTPPVVTPPKTPAAAKEVPDEMIECRGRGGLPNFFKKLDAGGEVRIAYLGGSITEAEGWRVLTREWFQKQYPNAKISEINAAISGTGADFGVCRMERDVLQHKPDLLFVEFAVNGAGEGERGVRTMEGIVRKAWQSNPEMDVCFVYTISTWFLKDIQSSKMPTIYKTMDRVADQYKVPSIMLGLEVAKLVKDDKMIFMAPKPKEGETPPQTSKPVFSNDGVHPIVPGGHQYYLAAFTRAVPALRAGKAGAHVLPAPLDAANWEAASQLTLDQVKLSDGWVKLDPNKDGKAKSVLTRMPMVYKATKPGENLSFRFKGTCFGISGLKGPDVGNFVVTVDDRNPVTVTFFDSYCADNRYRMKFWMYPGEIGPGEHKVKIELSAEAPDKKAILGKGGAVVKEIEQHKLLNEYFGDVLLVGELLKE